MISNRLPSVVSPIPPDLKAFIERVREYQSQPIASVAKDAVGTANLSKGAVLAEKIAAGAVLAEKIAKDAITTEKLINGGVTTDKLAAGAVTADKLAAGAVTAASVGAAPAGGSLSTDWLCQNLRTSTGYLYSQASGGSINGSVDLYDAAVSNRMVFRNAAGFQFYGSLSDATLGDVYAGDFSGDGYYLTGDLDTGMYSGGANVLAFKTGGSICAYFGTSGSFFPGANSSYDLGSSANRWNYAYINALNSGTILPAADSTYTIGNGTNNRFLRGWFDELITRDLESGTILPAADSTYTIGVTGNRFSRGWFDELYTGYLESYNHMPNEGNKYNLGSSGLGWKEIFYYTATGLSDKELKTDITDGDLGLDFVDALRSVKFRWRVAEYIPTGEKGTDGNPILTARPGVRFHYGLVADEVKAALSGRDFAGYVEDAESGLKGLRYDQIVSVLIKAVQELHGQVKEERQSRLALAQRLAALELALAPIGAPKKGA
jgi:hypothetical protein